MDKPIVYLTDWGISKNHLYGRIRGHPKIKDGTLILSSKIIGKDKSKVEYETEDTFYILETPYASDLGR